MSRGDATFSLSLSFSLPLLHPAINRRVESNDTELGRVSCQVSCPREGYRFRSATKTNENPQIFRVSQKKVEAVGGDRWSDKTGTNNMVLRLVRVRGWGAQRVRGRLVHSLCRVLMRNMGIVFDLPGRRPRLVIRVLPAACQLAGTKWYSVGQLTVAYTEAAECGTSTKGRKTTTKFSTCIPMFRASTSTAKSVRWCTVRTMCHTQSMKCLSLQRYGTRKFENYATHEHTPRAWPSPRKCLPQPAR